MHLPFLRMETRRSRRTGNPHTMDQYQNFESYLTTSVYRKPTHTNQYLAYDSHHPQSVKRGIVKCLYERAKRLVTKPTVISKEKKHLSSVLVSNGYPFSLLQKITKTRKSSSSAEPKIEDKSTAVLPYVKGLSEQLRRCLQQQGIRAVFKSETTLRSHLGRPKDAVEPTKQDGVVYRSTSARPEDLCKIESNWPFRNSAGNWGEFQVLTNR